MDLTMIQLLIPPLDAAGPAPGPGWLCAVPDILIGAAYLAIPLALARLVRRPLPVPRLLALVSALLVLAGCSHLLEAATAPAPAALLPAKLLTAALAWVTVPVVLRLLPQALTLRSAAEVEHEKAERKRAESGLQTLHGRLENLVAQRTATAEAWAQELARSEAALQRQTRILWAVLEGMDDAVAVVDAAGHFLVFNPAARRVFGADPDGATALEWMARTPCYRSDGVTALPPDERPLAQALGGTVATAEMLFRNPQTGERCWLSCSAAPLHDEGGEIPGAIAVYRDITAQKQSEERLHALTAYLESVREEERTRIARELHDELGQALTGLKMDLTWVRDRLALSGLTVAPAVLREKVIDMAQLVDATIATGRRIATELRPGILDDLGLVAALEWLAEDFHRRTGVPCDFHADRYDLSVGRKEATAFFRIAQESLTNVTRHAQATAVQMRLRTEPPDLILEVRDNGRGLAQAPDTTGRTSLGLLGMRERAVHLGGTVEIEGAPGKGTRVTARIPLTDQPAAALEPAAASDGECS
jgi:PAS domain S-box-containing protein